VLENISDSYLDISKCEIWGSGSGVAEIPVFWEVLLCQGTSSSWLLNRLCCLHLQGQEFFLDCLTTGTLEKIWRYQRKKLPSEVTLIIMKGNWRIIRTCVCNRPPIAYHLYLNVHYTSHVKVILRLCVTSRCDVPIEGEMWAVSDNCTLQCIDVTGCPHSSVYEKAVNSLLSLSSRISLLSIADCFNGDRHNLQVDGVK